MIAVKVEYTVKAEYAETNKRNIEQVMSELRAIGNPGVKYSSYVKDDGKSFVHFGLYSDEAAKAVVSNLPSFQKFQQGLKASGPEVPPNPQDLHLVGSAWEIFG